MATLRVVNGMSTQTSSTLTTAARENFRASGAYDGLPGRPGNSTIRWAGGLKAHPEGHEDENVAPEEDTESIPSPTPRQRAINPSLATLEKAVSTRIYFENLYFPLFRHPPSREQRRKAMERDMVAMGLSEDRKEELRRRWLQNETDYLREKRRKVDVSAFIKLKTIGHGEFRGTKYTILVRLDSRNVSGAFGVVSLVKERSTGGLYAMKQVGHFLFVVARPVL